MAVGGGAELLMLSLRHRIAQAGDTDEFLRLLARPGDGYGPSSLAGLAPLLARLIAERALRGPILEARASEESTERGQMVCGALTGFVELSQLRAWLASPPPHLVDHILAREGAGEALLLRPERVATLNATEGLGLIFMAYRMAATPEEQQVVIPTMFEGFRLFHAGYYCPLSLHPTGHTSRGDESLRALGFRPIDASGALWLLDVTEIEKAPFNPFIAIARAPRPRLGLSPAEKALLMQALLGYSDLEIAEELSISVETMKKR